MRFFHLFLIILHFLLFISDRRLLCDQIAEKLSVNQSVTVQDFCQTPLWSKTTKRTDLRSEALQHVLLRYEEAAGSLDFTDAHSGSWCCDSILCVAYNFPGEISGHFMSQTSGYLLKPTFVKCKNLTLWIWV